MQLSEVLRLFDSPLSQEQCWSICYGVCRTLIKKRFEDYQRRERIKYILNLDSLILTQRGEIEILHSEPNFQEIQKDSEIVFTIGNLICRCLDHGLDEVEICEVQFQDDLAELIGGMVLQSNELDEGIEDIDSLNESWESRKFNAQHYRCFSTITEVARFCEARLLRRNIEHKNHYSNVCTALYVEASELKAFLGHVLHSYVEENPVPLDDIKGPELAKRYVRCWAKLWLKVMNELRASTRQQRDVCEIVEEAPEDYQKTPFESMKFQDENNLKTGVDKADGLPENAENKIINFLKARASSQDGLEHINTDVETGSKDSSIQKIQNDWTQYCLDDTLEDDFLNGSYISDDNGDEENKETSTPARHQSSLNQEPTKVKNPIKKCNPLFNLDVEFLPDISLNSHTNFSKRFTNSDEADSHNPKHRLAKSEMNLHQIDINDSADDLSKVGSSLIEIFKIRQEITRAELEVTKNLDLRNSKLCFGCHKVYFLLFTRSKVCSVCDRKYCLKCMRKNTVVSSELAYAEPANNQVIHTGNPSSLLSSSQRFSKSMFNLTKIKNDKCLWNRNKLTNSVLIHMCKECEDFLKSIEREKSKQTWKVKLELDL